MSFGASYTSSEKASLIGLTAVSESSSTTAGTMCIVLSQNIREIVSHYDINVTKSILPHHY